MMHFVRTFSIYALSKRFKIVEKLYSAKALLKIAGGGNAYPTSSLSLDLPLHSRYYAKAYHQCFFKAVWGTEMAFKIVQRSLKICFYNSVKSCVLRHKLN